MVNVNKLKGKFVENGFSVEDVAKKIGVDRATLYRKINSQGGNISICEADKIVNVLGLSVDEATAIFFSQLVS